MISGASLFHQRYETYTVYHACTITIQIHYLLIFLLGKVIIMSFESACIETQRVRIITLAKVAECQQEKSINLTCSNLNVLI